MVAKLILFLSNTSFKKEALEMDFYDFCGPRHINVMQIGDKVLKGRDIVFREGGIEVGGAKLFDSFV